MARNGSGVYNRTQNDYVFGEIISETEVNSEFNDIASALTQSLSKDGQTVPTANLPMGGFKLTGLANGTARTDSAAIGQIQDSSFMWGGTAGGTSDALTIAPSPAITAYAAGQAWRLINQGTPNTTTTPTIAISGLANRTMKNYDGAALAKGVLAGGAIIDLVDDGTALRLVSQRGPYIATYPVLAGAMTPRTTNGPSVAVTELTTNKNMLRTLDFDATTQEFAQFEVLMPKGWDEGTFTFQPIWTAASGSGGVVWALQAVATSDDDGLDVAFGTEQTSTDTLLAANDRHIGPTSAAITAAGTPAEGDVVQFQIKRVPADASDTLAVDARLLGIRLFFTVNNLSDG